MLAQALAELPNECCGLLSGKVDANRAVAEVTHRYALVNDLHSPTEFLSEPKSMFLAVKDMRRNGIDVLAVYHSHPTSEPVPSRRDLERNWSSNVMNLIIGLDDAEPVVRGWWLDSEEFRDGSWEMI